VRMKGLRLPATIIYSGDDVQADRKNA